MNDKTRDFIEQNLNADIRQLALKGCRDKDVDLDAAIRHSADCGQTDSPSEVALMGSSRRHSLSASPEYGAMLQRTDGEV